MAVPAIISSNNSAAAGANNNGINGGYPILPLHLGEFGEECCGFVDDIKPPITSSSSYPNNTPTETWGGGVEESNNIKVGRYSEEERKERIVRYLKKRNQRNFNKTIKYACRKTLADRRVRVRGRFARNNELCEDEISTIKKMNDNLPHKHDLYYAHHHHDSIQFQNEDDEDDWLQEAMASLVYLSHSSPEEI
ncbi:zinc finger protein CONSTANS-LIKE 4 [Senna tora]|uniref:Zinc finger protein CONSTANS-LIKE 4 n=1 Tax=Senna tora TaxID=362788 RepID=A0A835CA75_9FABA|nr:zinc finger protein CONSTANS-LIKE 4 [Senna tora]